MNKNTFVKFSLTLVSAAVLAACSSSGGGDDNAAKAKQQEIAQKAAADKAAKKEAADKAAKKEAAAKEAAAKEAAVKSTLEVGHKFVQKTESNMNVGTGTAVNSDASTAITAMRIDLDPSLDTIVVAIPLDKNGNADPKGKQAYLEDFDFRKSDGALLDAGIEGLTELNHIYVGKATKNGAERNVDAQHLTKTKTMGTDEGVAVVYENNRLNYTDYEGDNVVDSKVKRTQAYLSSIDVDRASLNPGLKYDHKYDDRGSVAEVYGYRTFALGNSEVDGEKQPVVDAKLNNAPFTRLVDDKKQSYADGKLEYVQYGRVTSSLHAVAEANLKDGKNLGDFGTKVAGFGKYGSKGTENHYFYRGIDDTKYSATLAADLNKHYYGDKATGGSLQYQGHAVTYGIDHKFNATDGIPNAIGYKQELVSGTHVFANVDLATKRVTGNLYDVWRHGNRTDKGFKTEKVELANFDGNLANNGSIKGTSVRAADQDKGTFNANLFGDKAQELGGAIRSEKSLQGKQWGAVFGAEVQNAAYKGAKPTPKPTEVPAWGESTDQKDTNSPIKK